MDVTTIAAKITALLEEVYTDGVKKGRDLEYAEGIETMIEALKSRRAPQPESEPAPAHSRARKPVAQNGPAIPDPIRSRVQEALAELASDHQNGVYPDALADHTGIKVRQVRAVLRHLILTGIARRMARGKYLPASPLLNLNLQHAAQ